MQLLRRRYLKREVEPVTAPLRLAISLCLLAGSALANSQPRNLLINSSFEIEADGKSGPDGWHGDPRVFGVAERAAWHGEAYLRCLASGEHAGLWQAIRRLEPGTRLTLTARLRRPDGKAVTGLRVLATDPTWHWAAQARKIGDDEDWEVHRVGFNTPPTPMQFLRLRIHVYPEAEGETHLDGLVLCEGEDAQPYVTREEFRMPEREECARALAVVPGGIFLDFGPHGQPVMPGFAAVKADDWLTDDRKRGWLPGAKLEDALRTAEGGVVPRPDPLCGDFVRVSGQATFRLVVPPGSYHLTVWMGDFARFSHEDHDYEIWANGERLVGEHISRRQFLEQWYLAGANDDLAPESQDLFDHCVAPRFPRREFAVEAGSGELDIQWRAGGSVCVDGLALVPVASRQAGEEAIAKVEELRRVLFADATPARIQEPAARPQGAAVLSDGVSVWRRRLEDEEGEALGSEGLPLAACPGEEETIALVVASQDTLREVKAEIGQLRGPQGAEIGADASRSEWLLLRPVPGSHHLLDENRCVVQGDLLCPGTLPRIGPARARECWLTVGIPGDVRPGLYRGTVRVSASGKLLGEVPLRLRVRRLKLAPLDHACGAYYYPPSYYRRALGNLPVTDPGFLRLLEQELRVARQMGFNMVSRFPWPRIEVVDDRLRLDYSWTDTYMEIVAKVGLTGAIPGYQGVTHMLAPQLARYAPEGSERFAELLRQVIANVRDRGRQRGWPEVMVYLGDEFRPGEAEKRLRGSIGALSSRLALPI